MATTDAEAHNRPVTILPAPERADSGANGHSSPPLMPYTCQTCAKRKVRCDKISPVCSSCRKGKFQCFYQKPPPRKRKRNLEGDLDERIARYERILSQHGLLPEDAVTSPSTDEPPQQPITISWNEPETMKPGKLLSSQGRARYIGSELWRTMGDDEMHHMSDDEGEDPVVSGFAGNLTADPLTGAMMGSERSLLQYHPIFAEAMMLWSLHIENVEPICKILHIPSTSKIFDRVAEQPSTASKTDECLVFAVYFFAVFSLTDEDCAAKVGQPRTLLMQRYHFATRQALINASFLKTTEITVMQALVLFLLACRYLYDASTYWVLTGVAVRIGQRMGLHRDGEKLGLLPFDVQMRRRLFYQLLPLDGIASQLSGTGIDVIQQNSWDTQPPLNINDDQIWPGMTEKPEEQHGATEMIFCLTRASIGKFFAKTSRNRVDEGTGQFKDAKEAEISINEAEREVEEKYIRYCDIVNPLHFLTIGLARSAITAMRVRVKLTRVKNQTATDEERREIYRLAQKIIDTDTAAYAHTGVRRFLWQVRPFFAWGSWDSLIFILTSLRRPGLLSQAEIDTAWDKLEHVYTNHNELLVSMRALQIAFGRLTLKAWDANPPSHHTLEPAYITTLRSLRKTNPTSAAKKQDSNAASLDLGMDQISSLDPSPSSDANALFGSLPNGMDIELDHDFSLDNADWIFWDQLIEDYQSQGGQAPPMPT